MLRTALTCALALTLAVAGAQTAPPDTGTPIYVQPPQQQSPSVQPSPKPFPAQTSPAQAPELAPTIPQVISTPPVVLTPQPVPAAPAPDRFTVWGGLGTELYVFPGLMVGASVPVGRLADVNLGVRGSAELIVLPLGDGVAPAPFVNVDLLLSGTGRNLRAYGGPSVGTVPGYAVLLGGVGGVHGGFGTGPWGYFAEAKARVLYGAGAGGGVSVFMPGVNLGVTYRF